MIKELILVILVGSLIILACIWLGYQIQPEPNILVETPILLVDTPTPEPTRTVNNTPTINTYIPNWDISITHIPNRDMQWRTP